MDIKETESGKIINRTKFRMRNNCTNNKNTKNGGSPNGKTS